GGLDTQQATEQEVIDLELGVDGRQASPVAQDEADETIRTAECGVDAGTNTDQTTRDGKLQVVVLGEQRHNAGEDGTALDLAVLVLGDKTRADLNLVAQLEHTGQNGTTGNTTLELVDLGTGLVNVEGPDDHHMRRGGEV